MTLFEREYAKFLRADPPIKRDVDISDEDIANRNLILFGDPGSNALIARILAKLPLNWTRETLEIGGKSYPAGDTLPTLIYPNPLNPERYVVINSGHTFHAHEFRGTNALLYPRLGDWAALPADGGEPKAAGYFDERWQQSK